MDPAPREATPAPMRRDGFVWPPQPAPDDPRSSPRPGSSMPAPKPDANAARPRWWREVERVWLAPTALPLDARIDASHWRPDAPGVACERCGTTLGRGEAAPVSRPNRLPRPALPNVPAPGSTVLDDEFACAECRGLALPWDRFVRLGSYEGCLAEWIKVTKFTRCHWLGESLGRLLAEAVREAGVIAPSTDLAPPVGVAVVPIGTSFWRRVSRGIDHARCIARGVSVALDVPLVPALRREHRPTQRGLSPTARERNVKGAFRAYGAGLLGVRTVILVDDVCTTGATLREAARTLRRGTMTSRSGPALPLQILAAVLAVTPDSARRADVGEMEPPAEVPGGTGP